MTARDDSRPNILILCMDQWQTHMDVPDEVEFPAMERLEAQGVSFDRAYCTVPICTPSRSTMWTGVHAVHTGLWDNTNFAWIEERRPPEVLPAHEVTVLDVYGNLFYAGARTLERQLPRPNDAEHAVVILRLRGRTTFGATLVDVLANYADKLGAVGGRLYLTGISGEAYDQLVVSGKLRLTGPVRAYEATPVVGQSTREAYLDAQAWLVRQHDDD